MNTAPTYQFYTFAQLAASENIEARRAFGLETAKEVKAVAADLHHTDPDFLRMPQGGRAVPFMEVGTIVATRYPLTAPQVIALTAFFAQRNNVVLDVTDWLDGFGGAGFDEDADEYKYPRVAYRGGAGYSYTFYEIHA
jgi:hypothetical protein